MGDRHVPFLSSQGVLSQAFGSLVFCLFLYVAFDCEYLSLPSSEMFVGVGVEFVTGQGEQVFQSKPTTFLHLFRLEQSQKPLGTFTLENLAKLTPFLRIEDYSWVTGRHVTALII